MRKGEVVKRLEPKFYLQIYRDNEKKIEKSKFPKFLFNKLTTLISDGTHFTPKYVDKGVKFLSVKDVRRFEIDYDNSKFITVEEADFLDKRCKPQRNDVLLTKIGTYGLASVINSDERFQIFVSLALLRPNDKIILPEFLALCINTNLVFLQFDRVIKGAGVPDLHLEDIREIKIPVPPIKIQKQIIEKFEPAYRAKRAKETEAKSLLDGIDAYLLERLDIETPAARDTKKIFFVNLSDVSGNRLDCTFHKAILSNNFNSQFPTFALNKLVSTFCGGTPDKSNTNYWNGDIFWVSPKDFRGLEISKSEDTITEEGLKKSSTKLVAPENVLIVVRSGVLQHTLPVAVNKIDAAINQDVKALIIKDKSKLNPYYLTFYLKTFQDRLLPQIVKHGTIVQSVNTEQFDKLQIPLPPIAVQEEIAAHIQSIRLRAKELETEAQALVEQAKVEVEQMILGANS